MANTIENVKADYAKSIACAFAVTLVVRENENRAVQVQVAGDLLELITALRLAGEGQTTVKNAIIAAADLLKRP